MIPLDDLIFATRADLLVAGVHPILDGFAHDSRLVSPGDCFVAVRGPHSDGHDYLADAIERGAGALLVERDRLARLDGETAAVQEKARRAGAALVAVPDTRVALCDYAAHILGRWKPTVIAVTGAAGKTTTKEAIADVLSLAAPTFRSWRNYNDLLGVPLSLGRIEPEHAYAVVELAADRPGEIADLCAILRPQVGIVTNVSAAHLVYFGSVDAYANELAQLPRALPPDGVAIINGDDSAVCALTNGIRARVLPFSRAEAEIVEAAPLAMRFGEITGPSPVVFPHLQGAHWASAILAALAVGEAFGVPKDQALKALAMLQPLPGRMRRLEGADGIALLDDSHNATPASTDTGLAALTSVATKEHRPRIAVLGDMLHLGDSAPEEHRALGTRTVEQADFLVTQGALAETIASAARAGGLAPDRIAVTYTAEDAARAVCSFAALAAQHGKPPVVYVKGSEAMRMERVTELLLAHPAQAESLLDRQTQPWRRLVVMQPDRPTWLEIDLGAIGRNTQLVKEIVGPDVRVLVSLKADAYGHGAQRVARTVLRNGATWLGVATLSEAVPLREAGIDAPILIFGYAANWQAREVVRHDLRATIYSLETARMLSRAATDLGRDVRVHVKIDTGMARLGLRSEDVTGIIAFFEELRELPGLHVEGVFTHFATADSTDQSYARRQLARFHTVLRALDVRGLRPPLVHAANSAALLTIPEARFDLVRPGVAVYGLHPSDEVRLPDAFRPALAFKTQAAQVKDIPVGEGISYGATYITATPTRIAVLPVGYADGFRRAPANWGEVLIRGQRAPLVGRVCMDQCMIDVTHVPGVRTGDEVVLIGRQGDDELAADAVARRLGTISYEVVAELLARVPRVS